MGKNEFNQTQKWIKECKQNNRYNEIDLTLKRKLAVKNPPAFELIQKIVPYI